MAIPKIKATKVEHSRESRLHLGVAAGLVLLALIFAWLGVSRFIYKSNIVSALQAVDRNRQGQIVTSLEAAIRWNPAAIAPRLLLAKRWVDEEAPEKAEAIYKKLLEENIPQADQVYCGLGVIALRRADKAGATAAAAPFLKAARDHFKKAGAVVEAEIGLRHADLIEAVQAKDASKIFALRADFAKLQGKVRMKGAEVARDSMIDLYAGLGVTNAWGGAYSEEGAKAFNGCFNYAPSWPLPLINKVYIEAQQYAQNSMPMSKLKQDLPEIDSRRNAWELLANSGNPQYKDLAEAWFQYTIAVAYRFAEEGDLQQVFPNMVNPLMSSGTWRQRPEVWKLDCAANFRNALKPMADVSSKINALGTAQYRFDEFLRTDVAGKDEKGFLELRGIVLTNRGYCEQQNGEIGGDTRPYDEAVRWWTDALRFEKEKLGLPDGTYETNRNLAVTLKKLEKADAAAPYLAAAAKLGEASKSERIQSDLQRLRKFMAGEALD